MIQSNDGGANVSLDGGRTWSTQTNQPTAEIYQVAMDDQYPYRVYGAQQDNTTVIVPSLPLGNGQEFRDGAGLRNRPIIPDMANPEMVYGGCKGQFSGAEHEHAPMRSVIGWARNRSMEMAARR